MTTRNWFVLPPAQEYYYRNYHLDYHSLPPFKPGCRQIAGKQIDIIYPEYGAVLYLPKGFSGTREHFVFRAATSRPEAILYWHLDNQYIGQTHTDHQMACQITSGSHLLTLIDDEGNRKSILFEVK